MIDVNSVVTSDSLAASTDATVVFDDDDNTWWSSASWVGESWLQFALTDRASFHELELVWRTVGIANEGVPNMGVTYSIQARVSAASAWQTLSSRRSSLVDGMERHRHAIPPTSLSWREIRVRSNAPMSLYGSCERSQNL